MLLDESQRPDFGAQAIQSCECVVELYLLSEDIVILEMKVLQMMGCVHLEVIIWRCEVCSRLHVQCCVQACSLLHEHRLLYGTMSNLRSAYTSKGLHRTTAEVTVAAYVRHSEASLLHIAW